MSNISRRGFLGTAGLGLAAAFNPLRALNASFPFAAPPADRLITVFLRGAHDGVHTVFPFGDSSWLTARASILPTMLPLAGSTFAKLNLDFGALVQNSQPFWTNPAPGLANRVAWLHQVGNPQGLRSHFTEQQIYETADVQLSTQLNKEGFVPRMRQVLTQANPNLAPLFGVSSSPTLQRMYRSSNPLGLMGHLDAARLASGSDGAAVRQRTALASHLPQLRTGIAESVRQTADFALDIETMFQSLVINHRPNHFPMDPGEAAAVGLPGNNIGYRFMRDCEHAVAVAQQTTTRVVGVEIGGWDTHTNQVQQRSALDRWLAHGLRSIYDLTVNDPQNYTILVMTEFGRTNLANAALGTDHGVGGLMQAIGRKVNGGVYNCFAPGTSGMGVADWKSTAALGTQNAQNVATDFRTVFAEILRKRFLMTPAQIAVVLPGFAATTTGTTRNTELGCMQ